MPVIADQSRWDDLTQVCDPSPGLRSAGHARGTRLVPEAQPSIPRVVDLVPAAWPCVQYVVRLAMYTLCGILGHVYFVWYVWPCILYVVRLAMYTLFGTPGCVYREWYGLYHWHCHIHHMWYTPVPVLKCGSVMLVATAGKVTTSRLLSPVPPTSSNVICHKHRSYDLTQVYRTYCLLGKKNSLIRAPCLLKTLIFWSKI